MTPTAFATGWRDGVDESIATDPLYASDLHAILARLNDHRAPRTALDDVVSQRWNHPRYDRYDAAAAHEVGLLLDLGWSVISSIHLGLAPGQDGDEAANQAKLDHLPHPFCARCSSGTGGDDGHLEWSRPIAVRHSLGTQKPLVVAYQPAGLPLEIGHIEPATVSHLRRTGGVARWPHGHGALTLLLTTALGTPEILEGERVVESPFAESS